ncbi:hypothetical protein FB451DRAFT_1550801 [Mycena latifolia]|nr:hypothetical protein FB451DRAFT_1550801 [Mycena latifolia]
MAAVMVGPIRDACGCASEYVSCAWECPRNTLHALHHPHLRHTPIPLLVPVLGRLPPLPTQITAPRPCTQVHTFPPISPLIFQTLEPSTTDIIQRAVPATVRRVPADPRPRSAAHSPRRILGTWVRGPEAQQAAQSPARPARRPSTGPAPPARPHRATRRPYAALGRTQRRSEELNRNVDAMLARMGVALSNSARLQSQILGSLSGAPGVPGYGSPPTPPCRLDDAHPAPWWRRSAGRGFCSAGGRSLSGSFAWRDVYDQQRG